MCELTNADFGHLHCHSDSSLNDALPKPGELTLHARRQGHRFVALTDHGNMNGTIPFIKAATAVDDDNPDLPMIKPIIGMEAYTCEKMSEHDMEIMPDGSKKRKNPHLTLLAQNEIGYRNLMNLQSVANEEGFFYTPRMDKELLIKHTEGIVVLSGCYGSEISTLIRKGEIDKAFEVASWFKQVYGENYFIELHNHGMQEQNEVINPTLVDFSRRLGIKCVGTNDVHYMEKLDWQYHDVLINLRDRDGEGLSGKMDAYNSHQFWLKSAQEMLRMLPEKALRNTNIVAEMCDDGYIKKIMNSSPKLPTVVIPTDDQEFNRFRAENLPYHKPNEAYLAYLAFRGLRELGLDRKPEYIKRLRYEWQTIVNMGVTDYFIIQREMVEFCREKGILYGIRGSGVGSLLNHCLRICPVDPIDANLLFERFLNPGRGTQYKIDLSCLTVRDWNAIEKRGDAAAAERKLKDVAKQLEVAHPENAPAISKEFWVLKNQGLAAYLTDVAARGLTTSENECNLWLAYGLGITDKTPDGEMHVSKHATLPDIDSDIQKFRREEVIDWGRGRVGDNNFARISTQGTYQARAAVQGALKIDADFRAEWGEDRAHLKAQEISKLIPERATPPMTIEEAITLSQEDRDPKTSFAVWADRYARIIKDVAPRLIGRASSQGVHPAGVIMSSETVRDHAPLIRTKEGDLATGYDMNSVDGTGLVKYDYLGLSTLEMIDYCLKLIEARHGADRVPDLDKIASEKNDSRVFKLYADGKTATVFQFSSRGMRKSLQNVRVDAFEDLVAVAALFRPGPMAYIDDYAKGKRAPEKIKYDHELIRKHLEVTFGIMVYQEQAMFLAKDMASMSWPSIDKLRKAISKKSGKDFEASCRQFKEGALKNGVEIPVVDGVLALMKEFGAYCFNRCLHGKTYVYTADGQEMQLSKAYKEQPAQLLSMWDDGVVRPHRVKRIVKTGVKPLFEIRTQGGRVVRATAEHRFLTTQGYMQVADFEIGTELIVRPKEITDKQRKARRRSLTAVVKRSDQRQRMAERMTAWQVTQTQDQKREHLRHIHEIHPDLGKQWCAAGTRRTQWLHKNDPEWRKRFMERSLASVRNAYGTGPGYGICSIASNGMWCASKPERAMCEWLIEHGVDFAMHRVLGNGRVCDFYFAGVYWEMDGMDRVPEYFAAKYGDLPYVVVTPEDFKSIVSQHLDIDHVENGDPVISITPYGEKPTYDVEMEDDGPKNFIANSIVSHNSHSYAYARLSYQTAYLRRYFPSEWLASYLQVEDKDDKRALAFHDADVEGIKLRNPDVNESGIQTLVNKSGDVLLPLNSLKGVGKMVDAITLVDRPFENLRDFCYRGRLNKGTVRALAEGGALHCFADVRKMADTEAIMAEYEELIKQRTRDDKLAAKAAKATYTVDSPLFQDESYHEAPIIGSKILGSRNDILASKPKSKKLSNPFGDFGFSKDFKK